MCFLVCVYVCVCVFVCVCMCFGVCCTIFVWKSTLLLTLVIMHHAITVINWFVLFIHGVILSYARMLCN